MITALEIPTADGTCDAWLAKPEGAGPWPGVIFCMDAVGPRATLKEMAERLAANGYVVLLPNLFYRQRRAPIVTGVNFPAQVSDIPKILEQIMPLVERFKPDEALRDMHTFIAFLKNQSQVSAQPLGIFGYCMGGAMAIRTAANFPTEFSAVASFHAGGLVTSEAASPHQLLPQLRAALYVGHADQDPHMSAEQIATFNAAAAKLATPHGTELYKGAHHHFTMIDLPAYDPVAAERHWTKLLQLFGAHL